MTKRIRLVDARAELRVSQEKLAVAATLSKQVITNAEKGLTITRISAHAILQALNNYRRDAGKSELSIPDLDWKVQGEPEE